jgi:hypothetical protein
VLIAPRAVVESRSITKSSSPSMPSRSLDVARIESVGAARSHRATTGASSSPICSTLSITSTEGGEAASARDRVLDVSIARLHIERRRSAA